MSSQLISFKLGAIKQATNTNAGAVAYAGIVPAKGDKNKASKKQTPTTTDVKPVRPPTDTPDIDSIYVVTVEVPKNEPIIVDVESASNVCFKRGNFPFLSTSPARSVAAINVPDVSNKSSNNNDTTNAKVLTENKSGISSCINVGAIDGGIENTPLNSDNPVAIDIIVIVKILISNIKFD